MTDKRDTTALINPIPYPSVILWLLFAFTFGPFVLILAWWIRPYMAELNFTQFAENILTPRVLPTLIMMCAILAWEIAVYRRRFADWWTSRIRIVEVTQLIAPPPIRYGVIYVMKRRDGIYKIGKTHYLRNRLRFHCVDYGQDFDVVASWVVPDASKYERVALDITGKYFYSEGNRRELRKMTETELNEFVLAFTERVYHGFKKVS